jgi:hypothetical protein
MSYFERLKESDKPVTAIDVELGPGLWDLHLWQEPDDNGKLRRFHFWLPESVHLPKLEEFFGCEFRLRPEIVYIHITQVGFASSSAAKPDWDIWGFVRASQDWNLHVRGWYSTDSRRGWFAPIVTESRSSQLPLKIGRRWPFPRAGVMPAFCDTLP